MVKVSFFCCKISDWKKSMYQMMLQKSIVIEFRD